MKKRISLLLVAAMLLSMLPMAISAEDGVVLFSGTEVTASPSAPVVHTWTAEADGTLTVSMAAVKPGWRFTITDEAGNTVGLPKSSALAKTNTFALSAGTTYTFTATGFDTATWDEAEANITYTLSFLADETDAPVEKAEYEVSETALALGDNALTLLDTAETTIYVFEPTETAVYTFTAPEGATLGYWGAGSWFLSNPNSTTNTYEWTCTGVGQTAYIGVSGVDGEFTLNVAKTGDYTVVETPIVKYENKATLAAWTKPEGATWGSYVDVFGETHTAVLGDDGYYHLDSADGDVLVVNLKYQDIILSNALKSDRPVMYAYMYNENGQVEYKYDIGDAILAYEAVMDENGYYPVTEDILLFYQVYAVQAGTFTFHLTGDYNEDCVWMYCMRTMNMDDVTVDPSEPTDPTDPSEPEQTDPTDPSEPTPSEPVSGTVVLNTTVTATSSEKYTYKFAPETDGTLTVTVGNGTTNWVSDVYSFAGFKVIASASGSAEATYTAELTAGTNYYIRAYAPSGALAATPVLAVFTPAGGTTPEPSEPETDPTEPSVPTEPSEPETEPTEPSVPTEPSEPETEPTEPSTPSVPDEDVPAGTYYSITIDGNTTYYSASTGATLNANLKKITGSAYVKFYQDMNLGSSYTIDVYNGDITIDLNGCTITSAYKAAGALYVSGGNVTVVDTSAEADGLLNNTSANGFGIEIYSGSVTMLSGNAKGYMGAKVWAGATFNMNDGVVTGSQYGINALAESKVTVSGGEIIQSPVATFKYALYAASTATMSITGGNFNGAISGTGLNGKISGGYYTATVNAAYIASGCELQSNDDATYIYKVVDSNGGETEPSEPETEPTEPVKDAYAVSTTTLSVGSNTVSMISTAEATIFKFAPTEAGTYIITGPEGSKVGIWGYSTTLKDPNSTSNSCELTLANTGPTARVGVTGAEGQIVLTITKNEEPTEPSEPEETDPTEPDVSGALLTVTDEEVTVNGYTFEYTAATAGTLNVTVGQCSPGWRYKITTPDGVESLYRNKTNSGETCDYEGEAGNWKVVFYAYSSAEADNVAGTVSFTVSFTPKAQEPTGPVELISVTNEAVTASGYTYTFQAETTGTLNVTMGDCTPGWQYVVTGPNYDSGNRGKYSAGTSCDYTVTETGPWTVTVYAYTSADGRVAGTVSFTVTFTPDASEPEVEKEEYQVSDTALALGDNTLTLLDTAVTTIYVFEPTETAVYTFTAPEGVILGYWGAGSWFLSNPNSTTNTYEWTCTGVGQTAYIGVSGVDGEFTLNVAKTGDYEVVVTPIVPYENKATLETFTLPEGATLGEYVDVFGQTHTAVLGEDGYYHLDSVDGPILLIDMDYMDIVLSAALQSDRPVMYAYMYDEDGNVTLKYDIGNAVKAYEAVMDENGYYPVTEDILLFYQVYAVQAGTFTFHVSGEYNEDCVWMYCMRTMTLPNPEPTVELTHVSLNPGKDALGYKAAATNLPEGAHVEISLWITEDVVVTRATDTLRLVNILACNGGQTTINAKATIVDSEGNVIAESAVHQTTMMETLQTVNANWSTYNQTQQDAVKALCEQYADTVADWGLDNILVPETSAE